MTKSKYVTINTSNQNVKEHQSLNAVSKEFKCTPANIWQMKEKKGFPFEYRGTIIHDNKSYKNSKNLQGANLVQKASVISKFNYDIKDSNGRIVMSNLSQNVAEKFLTEKTGNRVMLPKGKFALPTDVKNYQVFESSNDAKANIPDIQMRTNEKTYKEQTSLFVGSNVDNKEYFDALTVTGKKLTRKQWNVLQHFMKGKTYREIGETIGNAEKTITGHMTRIFIAFGVSSQSELKAFISKHRDNFTLSEGSPIVDYVEPIEEISVTPNISDNKEVLFCNLLFAIISPEGSLYMAQDIPLVTQICNTTHDVLESHYERYGLPLELDGYKIYESKSFNKNVMNNISQPATTVVPNYVVGDYFIYNIEAQEVFRDLTVDSVNEYVSSQVNESGDEALNTGKSYGFPVSVKNLMIFDDANSLAAYISFLKSTKTKEVNVIETPDEPQVKSWWNRIKSM